MYRKVAKTFENPYGLEKIDNKLNNFLLPCIIGMIPYTTNIRTINGYLSKISNLLGLRNSSQINCGYNVSEVPFSLLINEKDDNLEDLVLSIISSNDKEQAKKIVRNLNIFSYCAGHSETLDFINNLYNGLIQKGYDEEDTKEILSQIFVLQIVDNLYDKNVGYISFPYVTSLTFHNIHDSENFKWINSKGLFQTNDKFSKIDIVSDSNNNAIILYNSFGEGSLSQTNNEHTFTNDYFKAPVFNTLISISLINAIYSSYSNEKLDLNLLMTNFNEILEKAKEFELKNKNLDEFTKEDLDKFNEYMFKFVIDYIKNKFGFYEIDDKKVELDNERIVKINEFLKMNKYPEYPFEDEIKNINHRINIIVNYYQNYDSNDTITIEINDNYGKRKINYIASDLIKEELNNLLKKLKVLVDGLNKLTISDECSYEIKKELEEYKSNTLKNILNPVILKIMQEYDVSVIDNDDSKKL